MAGRYVEDVIDEVLWETGLVAERLNRVSHPHAITRDRERARELAHELALLEFKRDMLTPGGEHVYTRRGQP